MRQRGKWLIIGLAVCAMASQGYGQFIEDALRFSTSGVGTGSRALSMGGAYVGVANDFTALYWNPAGLAQMQYGEFSLGLSYLNFSDKSTFFGNSKTSNTNIANLNTLGLVFPLEVRRGSAVLAFGFNRQSNFTTGLSFEGFNPTSSIIQSAYWAPDGKPYPEDISIAEDLKLAYADTNTGRYYSPIKNRLTQLADVSEGGGLNNWSVGGAIDVAKNLSLGVTLTYVSGGYTYDRTYKEQDRANVWRTYPYDFDELIVEETVESDITGMGGQFGLMYREPDRFRLGFSVKTPTTLNIEETFTTKGTSYFDSPDSSGYDSYETNYDPENNKYKVITPWVISAGASVIIKDLVLSGDIEFIDWKQMKFDDANSDLIALNSDIKKAFRPTTNFRVGAEYNISTTGIRVRGGFMYNTSPYKDDPSTFDQKYVTGGLGIPLGESTMLDLVYVRGWWNTYRSNYDQTSLVNEKVTTNTGALTFSYRF